MIDSTKVILISQVPLPYSNIGSWPTLYANYLLNDHQIDFIICKRTVEQYENLEYCFVKDGFFQKVKEKIIKNKFAPFIKELKKIIISQEKYIIQVIDDFKLIPKLEIFLVKNNLRSQCYIQFFYHGFSPHLANDKSDVFFKAVDEMIFLTQASYKAHLQFYTSMPIRASILHNGIDTTKFFKLTKIQKAEAREKHNVMRKIVFLWCSQNKPKKGLDLILDVWKRVYEHNKDIELLVVGTERGMSVEGVRFLGRIPNNEIAIFYQISDVYLFPSLWQEGFGLTLVEALHSGCYCIASKMGGIPEVLANGKYGKLIVNPNFIEEWVDEINFYIQNKPQLEEISNELYSREKWNEGMNDIINSAKKNWGRWKKF